LKHLARYGIVGVASNLVGYVVYLLVTWLGVEPKIAMSFLYLLGAIASFFGNRQWTFAHTGHVSVAAVRFAIAHAGGYLLNLTVLIIFVDRLHLPHQAVQALAIFVVAGYLFIVFRFFVFPRASTEKAGAP
jgi:putative flippase GtrA